MDNQREIFKILNHYHRFCPDHITVRENLNLTPAIISGARLVIRKLFFRTWSHAILAVALRHEHVFVAFWPTILLAGPQSDHLPRFWDGGGNFLDNLSPGTNHSLCGYADLSFTVLLSEKLFTDLQSLLENPTVANAKREAEPPPDISREQALAVFHQRYRPSLVRSFEIDDSPPSGLYTRPSEGSSN